MAMVEVLHDYDDGWIVLVEAEGEMEDAGCHYPMPAQSPGEPYANLDALADALHVAKLRGERVRYYHRWSENDG